MHGKTVELFLVDGDADSVIIAEMSNWNGKAFKLPRQDVATCKEEEISGVGVYFLFGISEESGMPSVYVGESEDVKSRLVQHIRDAAKEDFDWNTAVCFFGKNLNKALIRYLEDRFTHIAREAGRCEVMTKKTYQTTLKRSDESTMEEYIDNASILIHALGYDVLVPQPKQDDKTIYFYCTGAGAEGKGFRSKSGFTVVKGSVVSDHIIPSFEKQCHSPFAIRKALEANGTITDRKFTRDFEFGSPSSASAVVLGRSSNGHCDWKSASKKKLGEYLGTL